MKTKLSLIALIAIAVTFAGCEGKEGPQGPAGSKGDTGATGSNGATGATGTANVIYSEWINLPVTPSNKGIGYKYYSIADPKITSSIFSQGIVYAYARSGGSAWAYALPQTLPVAMHGEASSISYSVVLREGIFYYIENWVESQVSSSKWNDIAKPTYFSNVRYVIIPGGVKARVAGLDYTDYEAVKAHYGLED